MSNTQVQIFESKDGKAQLKVSLQQNTVWLSQAQMSELFDTTPENVLMHLKNIFKEQELTESATTKEFLVVRQEGKRQVRRRIKHYSLDAIISVGYRVSSKRATQFRQWATQVLNDYLVQGYTLNERRLQERGIEFEQALSLLSRTLRLVLILWYLRLNQHLLAKPVEQLINDNTLVALALLVAESLPNQKELMIRLIEHFILLREPADKKD